jgi:hypothetical protein
MAFSASPVFESANGASVMLYNDACGACCGANHVQPIKVAARALIISGLIHICPFKKVTSSFFAEKPLKAH